MLASALLFFALTQSAASVFQMMKGSIVLITAGFGVIFFKEKRYCFHWLALMFIVVGLATVAAVAIESSEEDKVKVDSVATRTTVLGVTVLIISQCLNGALLITEEKILRGHDIDPLYIVGFEGFWGCLFMSILLPIFQ